MDACYSRDTIHSVSDATQSSPFNYYVISDPSNSEERLKFIYDGDREIPTGRAVFDDSKLPLDSRVIYVPLNEQEHKCWEQFLMFNKGNPSIINNVSKMTLVPARTVELDHPFAPVVYKFAISAFNELYKMYVKDVPQNIYEADIKDVKYSNLHSGQLFYITLEAIEEYVVGVYEARVLCSSVDGRRSLIKFVRSPGSPIGRKLKGMANLIRMKKRYKALKDEKKDIKAELKKTRCKAMKAGKQKAEEESPDELICLKEDYKAVKDVCRLLHRQIQELEPSDWEIKTTNPDDWCVPDKITGLQPRSGEHPCGGYDYINPLAGFSMVSGNYKPGKPLVMDPSYKYVMRGFTMVSGNYKPAKPLDLNPNGVQAPGSRPKWCIQKT